MKYRLEIGNQSHKVEILPDESGKISTILIDDQEFLASNLNSLNQDKIIKNSDKYILKIGEETFELKLKELNSDLSAENSSNTANLDQMKEFFKDGSLIAPMPGKIIDIRCSKGDMIERGKIILSLEAMKMENEIHTPFNIIIKEILVTISDSVTDKQLLIKYEQVSEP